MRELDTFSRLLAAIGGRRGLAYRPYSRACCGCLLLLGVLAAAAALFVLLTIHR